MTNSPVTTVPSQFVLKRLPQDDDELWITIFALWGYRIPRTAVCSGHVAPFTAFAEAYFARQPASIWKASRGLGGKSRTLAILGLTEAALLGIEVTVLGGSSGQSRNVHDATKDAWHWHAAPRSLLARPPTTFDTVLVNGGHMRTLTASQTSVRGPHPPRLRCDEVDEMEQGILDAALGQPMEQTNRAGDLIPTQVVLSSTHQYPDRVMSEMIRRFKLQGLPTHQWCFKETSNTTDGWLTPQAIQRAKEVVSEMMWKTEYELQEPSFEGRVIDTDLCDAAFDESLGTFDGNKAITTDPQSDGRYITSVDWAKERDQTIIGTFDMSALPWVCVAWQKINRTPWPIMVQKAIDQWRKFGGKFVHDQTGVGNVVDDMIRQQLSLTEVKQVKGVIMSGGRDRQSMFTEYVSAIEHGDIKYPRIEYAWTEHRYCLVEDLYGRGHPPDSLVVGALAWGERRKRLNIGVPTGGTRAASPWQL